MEDSIKKAITNALAELAHEHSLPEQEMEYLAAFTAAVARSDRKMRQFFYVLMCEGAKEAKRDLAAQAQAVEQVLSDKKKKVVN